MNNIVDRLRDGKTVPLMEERIAAANTIEILRQRVKELEGYKAAWVETSKHRDMAEKELTAERDISDKLEKALKTICADTEDKVPPFRSLGASGPAKYIACAAIAELAAMRKGETEC